MNKFLGLVADNKQQNKTLIKKMQVLILWWEEAKNKIKK
jgi:hypothetical protein